MPFDFEQFKKDHYEAWKANIDESLRNGPTYSENYTPLHWHDQFFEKRMTPSGTVECQTALRVGQTRQALNIVLVASHDTADKVVFESGSTITLTTSVSPERDGTYEDVGPSICVTAPTEGIAAAADEAACVFAIDDYKGLWLKVKLAFSGTISGGTLDCALAYVAR